MTDVEKLIEGLDGLGITMWVDGKPYGRRKNGGLVGYPKCTNCESSIGTGITFGGNGSLCRGCMDHLRLLLFKLIDQ